MEINKFTKSKTLKITTAGILSGAALALSFIERTVAALFPLLPGIRPGFSNIVVLFACAYVGFPYALAVTVIKSGFVFLISGATAAFFSISGGLLSVIITAVLLKTAKNRLSYMGISVISSVMHNLGQLIAASITVGSSLYFGYAPVLLISGVIFGAVTGIIFNCIAPVFNKLFIK